MSLAQALWFFFHEALLSLRRSWKVSALAVLTIAVSLFVGSAFLLISSNLQRVVESWRQDARVVVYLEEGASEADTSRLRELAESRVWVRGLEQVSGRHAEERFRSAFPGLQGLLSGWDQDPLPASLEIAYEPSLAVGAAFEAWLADLEAAQAVAMVDDDRQWLRQVESLVGALRALGVLLGGVLLVAATFTIASVVRLTAYLYRDEIAVLRLVGATEFMIRGPFVAEGLIQGLLGGVVGVGVLAAVYGLLASGGQGSVPAIRGVLTGQFLPPAALAAIIGLGAAAGLFGAVVSLRRETVG
jgi:cell division transport system permease protein